MTIFVLVVKWFKGLLFHAWYIHVWLLIHIFHKKKIKKKLIVKFAIYILARKPLNEIFIWFALYIHVKKIMKALCIDYSINICFIRSDIAACCMLYSFRKPWKPPILMQLDLLLIEVSYGLLGLLRTFVVCTVKGKAAPGNIFFWVYFTWFCFKQIQTVWITNN